MRRRGEVRVIGFLILFSSAVTLVAQVSNNSIANRSELKFGETQSSNTKGSTVEWNCVNKSLTNKCLIYHNDQWFYFVPEKAGAYFLNISSQACRDKQGVQLVIIEGNPCETKSYRVKLCIPKIYQHDVFVELDSLKAHTLYLVNIDGFLHDFCEFQIQWSDSPKGFPQLGKSLDTLGLSAETRDDLIYLRWRVDKDLLNELKHFELYRTTEGETGSDLRSTISAQNNTLGKPIEEYMYVDTVSTTGKFVYTIVGIRGESGYREILDRIQIQARSSKQYTIQLPLDFSKPGRLEISIIDPVNSRVLRVIPFDYNTPIEIDINMASLIRNGVTRFWVRVRHIQTKEFRLLGYELSAEGELRLVENKKAD